MVGKVHYCAETNQLKRRRRMGILNDHDRTRFTGPTSHGGKQRRTQSAMTLVDVCTLLIFDFDFKKFHHFVVVGAWSRFLCLFIVWSVQNRNREREQKYHLDILYFNNCLSPVLSLLFIVNLLCCVFSS